MANNSCTVKFLLITRRKLADGRHPIYCRISMNRKKAEFKTGEYCLLKDWDERLSLPKRNPHQKELLKFIESEVFRIRRELMMSGEEVTAKVLKEAYLGIESNLDSKLYLMNYFDIVIDRYQKREGELSRGTIRRYYTTKNILADFLKTKGLQNILLKDVNLSFIKDFDAHLLSLKVGAKKIQMSRNTANGYHTRLRTVLKSAYDEELIARSPYSKFQLKEKVVEIEVLSEKELKKLRHHKLGGNTSLQRIRDIFIFSCYTGLRYIDAMRLSPDDIHEGEDGRLWIYMIQQKTQGRVYIPMLDFAKDIYDQYEEERKETGKILPKISNQKVNAYLKTIAEVVGIKKNLTHKIARHTFATTVLLDNGVPIDTVAKYLGHKNLKSTRRYAQYTKKHLSQYADQLNKKLK
jgi:integrase/recombinase XerD